jgi:hypothetical protein
MLNTKISPPKICLKEAVPKLNDPDIKKYRKKYPLGKEEIVSYLLKLHMADNRLS